MAGDVAASRERRRSWVLPSMVGLGTWITTGLALSINLATDLLPKSLRDWAPYPWAVWSGAFVLAFCAARTATAIQRRSAALTGEIRPARELSIGQNSGTIVVGSPETSAPATPIVRFNRHDGEKSESFEFYSESALVLWMQMQADGGSDQGGRP